MLANFMSVSQALVRAGIALIIIILIVGSALAFDYYSWNWGVYGAIVGIVLGLLLGVVILVRVSEAAQAAIVGAAAGMFLDLVTTAATSKPATALNALAKSVADVVQSARGAAEATGLPNPAQLPIAVGLWCFIATVALVFVCGLVSSGSGSGRGTPEINIRNESE
jgi:hypothetical protein